MSIDLDDPIALMLVAAAALEQSGAECAAYGGLALGMYGEPRETRETPEKARVGWKRKLGGIWGLATRALLGRCRTNDYRPAAGERKRHAIACDGFLD